MRKDLDKEQKTLKTKHQFYSPNVGNIKILNTLKEGNVVFAGHMIQRNDIVEAFLKFAGLGTNLLDQPVCEGCEKPGLWGMDENMNAVCHCTACGRITKNPITVSQYMLMELKKSIPEELLEQIAFAARQQEILMKEERERNEEGNEEKIRIITP